MIGKPFPYYNTMTLEFGTYVYIFEDNNSTNTTKSRTTPVIALNNIGNIQGEYFLSLGTGHAVDRRQQIVLPMPNHVIKLAEEIVTRKKQPLTSQGIFIFEWRPGMLVDEETNDEQED